MPGETQNVSLAGSCKPKILIPKFIGGWGWFNFFAEIGLHFQNLQKFLPG